MAVACCLLLAPAAMAAPGDTGAAAAEARLILVDRFSFIKTEDLDFGRIIAGTTAGTVTIRPDGTRTSTGGALLASGPSQPASFSGYGRRNRTVTIRVGALSRTLTRVGGTQTMTFDTFIIGSTPLVTLSTSPLSFTIASTTGMFAFPVGATLRVKPNQAPGQYRGTFSIILDYQ